MAEEIATEQKVQALSLNEAVKRVFSIQEERKAEYERLKRSDLINIGSCNFHGF